MSSGNSEKRAVSASPETPRSEGRPSETSESSPQDLQAYLRELEVRTEELETQNQSLRCALSGGDGEESSPYRSLYEFNPDAIYRVDPQGRFVDANPAAIRQSGYSLEELKQMTFMQLCLPHTLEQTITGFQENLTGQPSDIETGLIRKDGRRVDLLVSAAPIANKGPVVGVFAIAKDITQRKAGEEAIRHADERLRLAAEAAGFGTYLHSYDPERLEWSPELKDIFGLPADAPPSFDEMTRRIHPDDRERVQRRILENARSTRASAFEDELRILLPDGSLRWVHVKGQYQPAVGCKPGRSCGAVLDVTERKRADEALRESERRLRGLIEAIPDTVQFKDAKGRWMLANQPALKAFSLQGVKWHGRTDSEIAADAPRVRKILEACRHGDDRVRREQRPVRLEETIPQPNGEVLTYDVIKVPLRTRDGEYSGLLVVGRDISERKQTEEEIRRLNANLEQQVADRTEALRKSEYRFRGIYTHAVTGIAIVDWQGRFVQCNPAYSRIVGYSENELEQLKFDSLIHPDDQEDNRKMIRPLREGSIPYFEIENRYLHKKGHTVWVHKFVSALRDDKQQEGNIMALVTDISERHQTAEALRHSERALATFFEDAPIGLLWINPGGEILRVNRAQLEMLGYADESKVKGRSILDFDIAETLKFELLQPLEQRKPIINHRAHLRRADGSVIYALIDAKAVYENGQHIRSDWFARDITQRVKLERQLLEVVERERQQLGAELHDHLGQILHGIHYLASELKERLHAKGVAEAAELERVIEYLDEALSTTRNVAKGLQPVPPVPEGLRFALQDLANLVSKLYGVDCAFVCPEPVDIADQSVATHLFRIAQEAVTNAIKHADCKRISIQLKSTPKRLILGIRDDGQGCFPLPSQPDGMGLRVMQFRAAAIKGSLVVQNQSGRGMEVVCTLMSSKAETADS